MMRSYRAAVSIPKLFAILFALAVLIAPGVTGSAMAATSQHGMEMMAAGHCDAPAPSTGPHDKMDGKSCCTLMCMAVAVAVTAAPVEHHIEPAPAVFAVPALHLVYLGEIATPPPRGA